MQTKSNVHAGRRFSAAALQHESSCNCFYERLKTRHVILLPSHRLSFPRRPKLGAVTQVGEGVDWKRVYLKTTSLFFRDTRVSDH